jgi:nitroreductase
MPLCSLETHRYKPRLTASSATRYFPPVSIKRKRVELRQAIYSRRAVRGYTDEPLDKAVITSLIQAAIQAPSAVNEQPWSFTVVQDRTLLKRISSQAKAFVLASPPRGLSSAHLQHLLADPDYDIFYGAPALIVICGTKAGAWLVEDCTLAAENLMLAACAEQLGSCWIGFAQGWLDTAEGRAAIALPADYKPIAPIIVGHPRAAMPPVPRHEPQIKWL